jgi:hypothetical protein
MTQTVNVNVRRSSETSPPEMPAPSAPPGSSADPGTFLSLCGICGDRVAWRDSDDIDRHFNRCDARNYR